jgi:hypothetical protein
MRQKLLHLFILFIIALSPARLLAQGYINFSTYLGGSSVDSIARTIVVNGETFILATTTSANYPVTNGSHYSGGRDAVLTKFNHNGSMAFSTYIGGSGDDNFTQMEIVGGNIFIAGASSSPNFPVTNGSTYGGKNDIIIAKLNATGNTIFAGYFGGINNEFLNSAFSNAAMMVENNELYVFGSTSSPNFPIVNGTPYSAITNTGFVIKLNTADGSTVFSTCLQAQPGSGQDAIFDIMRVENGEVYISGQDQSYTGIVKLDANGSVVFHTYIGISATAGQNIPLQMQVVNGEVSLFGISFNSNNIPITDGNPYPGGAIPPFLVKLDVNGNISFAKYISTQQNGSTAPVRMKVAGNNIYVVVTANDGNATHITDNIIKLDITTGNIIYSTAIKGITPTDIEVVNDEVYLNGTIQSSGLPVTNGSAYNGSGTNGFVVKLNTGGDIAFAGYLGATSSMNPMTIINNKLYMTGSTNTINTTVGNGSFAGGTDNILFVLNSDGSPDFSTYLGGSNNETNLVNLLDSALSGLQIDNGEVYITGTTASIDYPVSNNSTYKGSNDIFFTRIQFCPFDYDVADDTLSPSVQTTCKAGLGELIKGKSIAIVQNEAPVLYRNGVAQTQNNSEASYQWQTAADPAGPWTNISTAGSTKNYSPTGGNATQYYRRLAYTLPGCGSPATDTSDIAIVFINTNIAPVVNAGGNFYTCPGTAIIIGAAPTVSGGTPPYSLNWDNDAGTVANPVVSPNFSTVYTLEVTDSLGCKQLGQAIVNSYKANAGPDKSNCAGTAVQIGASPISGLSGITYSWNPATDLTDATIAQPLANPVDTATYALTVTLPVSGGGSCVTSDTVTIIPVSAPVADFAGPDHGICLGDSVSLGLPAEAGFTYTWAPGNYLRSNTSSTTTFYGGPRNGDMPVPNPATFYVTAKKGYCSFTDQTTVAVIEAMAGDDGCGPRIIGWPDRTPNINETYLWTKDAGPGTFLGPTDQPQVLVSSSGTGTTTYTLLVLLNDYNGHFCIDQVVVPPCGCNTVIQSSAKYKCPSFDLNNGDVTLSVGSIPSDVTYKWSPSAGLSDSTGSTVKLTDNIPRTYTVTTTSIYDTSVHYCSASIDVNNPSDVKPVFTATDVSTCVNKPITIGDAPIAGYGYQWIGTGLSSNSIANPVATLTTSENYLVTITDNSTGCAINDNIAVNVEQVDAGTIPSNYTVCDNAIIKLGVPAVPNITYSWYPPNAPWQNGTDSSSAQPEVLVATSQVFARQATSPSGCSVVDVAFVTINNTSALPDAPDTTICIGTSVRIGSPALPGVTYLWTPATGLSDPTIAQPIATPGSTTIYSVLATFPSCTIPATDQVTVTVSDPTFTLPPIDYCPSGGPVSLGVAAPAGMTYYGWSPYDNVSNNLIANPTTLNPPPSAATAYTLTVVNTTGCQASSTVTINPKQSPPIAGTSRAICTGNTTSLGSTTNETGAGISYQWSPATYLDNSTSIAPTFTAVETGTFTYTVTKTDAALSCISTATVTVTVNSFTLPIIVSPTICQNSCKEIGVIAVPGAHYQWSPATGLSDPSIADPILCVGTSNTSYSLLATGATGCTATLSVPVIVSHILPPAVTVPPVTVCSGATNVSFNPAVAPAGTYNYTWRPDDASLSNINIAAPQIYLTGTGSKQYTLTVTDPVSGCTNTATTTLVINTCSVLAETGDYVWYDNNENGLQDINESGVSGVTVTAYNSLGFPIATAITDATGHYLLKNIQPGSGYYIIFSRPSGYNFTIQNIGGAASINNSKPDITGRTAAFTLNAGDTITTMDAGIIPVATALPITLTNFTGQLSNNETVLSWQTNAEFNNHYFIIEKSIDGINYAAIGTVNGNGTTTTPHDYSFIDTHPAAGNNYYRLLQVDYDNSTAYSNIIVVANNASQTITAVYLPQQNAILVTFDKMQKGRSWFNLFADNGQLISSTSAENIITEKINTNTLSAGIYMLQIISGNNNYTRKIFVNK